MNASVRAASRTDVGADRTRWRGKDRTARPLPVKSGWVAITCVCWASCGIASPSAAGPWIAERAFLISPSRKPLLSVVFSFVNPLVQQRGLGDRRDFLSIVSIAPATPRPRDPGQPLPADDPDHVGEVRPVGNSAL